MFFVDRLIILGVASKNQSVQDLVSLIVYMYNVPTFQQRFKEYFNFSKKFESLYDVITSRTVMYNNALPELKINAQSANGCTLPVQ